MRLVRARVFAVSRLPLVAVCGFDGDEQVSGASGRHGDAVASRFLAPVHLPVGAGDDGLRGVALSADHAADGQRRAKSLVMAPLGVRCGRGGESSH